MGQVFLFMCLFRNITLLGLISISKLNRFNMLLRHTLASKLIQTHASHLSQLVNSKLVVSVLTGRRNR